MKVLSLLIVTVCLVIHEPTCRILLQDEEHQTNQEVNKRNISFPEFLNEKGLMDSLKDIEDAEELFMKTYKSEKPNMEDLNSYFDSTAIFENLKSVRLHPSLDENKNLILQPPNISVIKKCEKELSDIINLDFRIFEYTRLAFIKFPLVNDYDIMYKEFQVANQNENGIIKEILISLQFRNDQSVLDHHKACYIDKQDPNKQDNTLRTYYLFMELCTTKFLNLYNSQIKTKTLNQSINDYFIPIANAISSIREQGYFHIDNRLNNVYVCELNKIKISNFWLGQKISNLEDQKDLIMWENFDIDSSYSTFAFMKGHYTEINTRLVNSIAQIRRKNIFEQAPGGLFFDFIQQLDICIHPENASIVIGGDVKSPQNSKLDLSSNDDSIELVPTEIKKGKGREGNSGIINSLITVLLVGLFLRK